MFIFSSLHTNRGDWAAAVCANDDNASKTSVVVFGAASENKILTLVATNVQTRQQLENSTPALIKLKQKN